MAASRRAESQSSSMLTFSDSANEIDRAPVTNHLAIQGNHAQPSENSLEQEEPKLRWQDDPEANVWKLWWMELLAIVVSLACLGANIAFLAVLNNKEYKSWKIARVDFTPNTIISIIATFTKASLLLPVAEVLSQLKWLHFQDRMQQLYHLQVFDDASRGPLGSLRLLWKVNRNSSIASLAAIVTVLALALEPFTQQVIRYPTKQTPATNVTAIIGATNVFDPNAYKGISNSTVLQANEVQQLNAAIDSAIIKKATDASYSCPSAECTWPVFTSLGLCTAYQDITSIVDVSCEDKGADVSKNSTYRLCNYTLSAAESIVYNGEPTLLAWNLWQTTGDGVYRPSTWLNVSQDFSQDTRSPVLDVIYFEESYDSTDSGAPDSIKPTMTRFRLDWCSKYYGRTTFYNGTLHDMPWFVVPLTYNGGGDAQPDFSNLTFTEAQLFNETNDNSYQINDDLSTVFQNLLVSLLVTSVFAQDSNPDVLSEMLPSQYLADFTRLGALEWNTAYSKGMAMYYANNKDILKTFDNIATGVTNQIRSSYASTNVTGTATYTIVYIEVVWPWLIFSIIMTLLAAALLGVTMWISSRLLGNESLRYDSADGKKEEVVDFDPNGDVDNPMDWPKAYKWGIVALLAFMAFTVTFTCICLVPVANEIVKDIGGHKSKSSSVLLVTIWELGEAAGPLFIAPLSEVFGRYPVLNIANIAFVAVTLMASFSPTVSVLIAARFLTGLAVSSNVLNPAIVGDMFISEQRGAAMSCIMLCPLLGGAFGPAIAGAIADSLGWRPVLWICATIAGICALLLLTCFRETFKVPILNRRAERLRKETGNPNIKSIFEIENPHSTAKIWESIMRPAVVFASSGVLQAMSVFGGVSYTFFYVVSTTLPDICEEIYGLNPTEVGFVFISFSVGSVISVILCNRLLDRIYITLRDTHKGVGLPEYRLPLVIVGAFTIPLSVTFYGWIPALKLPLIYCLLAVASMGVTGMLGFLPVMSYVVDAFGLYSASAMTAIIVTRCLMGTFLPLVTMPLVERLGWGWGFMVLAAGTVALAPIPAIVMRYGARWREGSVYTRGE